MFARGGRTLDSGWRDASKVRLGQFLGAALDAPSIEELVG